MSVRATLRRLDPVHTEDLTAQLHGSPQQRARLVLAAAKTGELQAQVMLGQLLLQGSGIGQDQPLAVHWFTLAARQGSAMAHNMLGRCNEHGWGVVRDEARAASHYRQAAQAGLDWGLYHLANLTATGRGVAQNLTQAFRLYQSAAQLGHAKSWNLLGRCYEEGLGTAQDAQRALHCYQKAAEGGDFRGQFSLAGVLIAQGRIEQARYWLNQALAQGNLKFLRFACAQLAQADHPLLRELSCTYQLKRQYLEEHA